MAEPAGIRRLALGDLLAPRRRGAETARPGVVLGERPGLAIWQIAAWRAADVTPLRSALAERLGVSLPAGPAAARAGEMLAFHIAPRRWWLILPEDGGQRDAELSDLVAGRAALTDLGHARTVVRLGGPQSLSVLAKLCRIDLLPRALPAGRIAQTPGGQEATLIHALGDAPGFDLYLPRSLARSAVESLLDTALEFGLEIAPSRGREP
jgi:sarcosine oxidase subunit gamma